MTTATLPNRAMTVLKPTEVISQVDTLIGEKRDQLLALVDNKDGVVERMRVLTLHALANPKLMEKLQKADIATIYTALRECATLGLMPIPSLAEGYFVPYWNGGKGKYDIQFQVGYQGLAKLIRNSGRVLDVDANVAYEGDQFDYDEGSGAFVRHKRALKDRGNRIAAYAVAWLPGGLVKVRVLDMATVEMHRQASKQADGGPWVEWYDAMAAKTALTQLGKYLPKSEKVEQVLISESEAEERYTLPPPPRRPSPVIAKIHDRLGITAPEPAEEAATEPPLEAEAAEDGPEMSAPSSAPTDVVFTEAEEQAIWSAIDGTRLEGPDADR